MAKKSRKGKKRRSAAQIAAFKKMIAAGRAKRGAKRSARKARKAASRGKRRSGTRRARRTAAMAPIVKRIYVQRGGKRRGRRKVKIEVRAVKRAKRRRGRARGRLIRTLSVNPGRVLGQFIAPITGVLDNAKASLKSAAGIAGIAGGAIGAVAGGTLIARMVMPTAMKLAPGFAASPIGARVLAALCYYGAGFAIAKLVPANDRVKKGILAGAVASAIIEVVKPGTVQRMVAQVPILGPVIAGNLGGIEPELGDYVEQAVAGLAGNTNEYGGAALIAASRRGGYDTGIGAYEVGGVGEYAMGAYEMGEYDAATELVNYGG